MPGLLRGMARTAVVAGTATAVSNRVSRRQARRWGAQEAARSAGAVRPSAAPAAPRRRRRSRRAAQGTRRPQGPGSVDRGGVRRREGANSRQLNTETAGKSPRLGDAHPLRRARDWRYGPHGCPHSPGCCAPRGARLAGCGGDGNDDKSSTASAPANTATEPATTQQEAVPAVVKVSRLATTSTSRRTSRSNAASRSAGATRAP